MLVFDVFFNHDLTPCSSKDSGIGMKVYMGSAGTIDIGKPLPEGRYGANYGGDYLEIDDEDQETWIELPQFCLDSDTVCGNK